MIPFVRAHILRWRILPAQIDPLPCTRVYIQGGGCLVGKSARNSMEFRNYSDSGPFELRNFHLNFIFLIVKCVPANLEHVPAGSESSPTIDSSNFTNQKMFPPFF